jgi:hypothetical protein
MTALSDGPQPEARDAFDRILEAKDTGCIAAFIELLRARQIGSLLSLPE